MAATTWAELKAGAREVIEGVTGFGKVATRQGESPTWMDRPGPKRPFWEVSIGSALETDSGAGPQAFEDVELRVDCFTPFSLDDNSETFHEALIFSVRTAFRNNPTLRNATTGVSRIRDTGRPQITLNELVNFEDGQKTVRCHHTRIVLRCRGWFTYTPA